MTKKSIATAKCAVACALASALAFGAAAAPALAQPATGQSQAPAICAQASTYMSEGEAVYIARAYLGIAAEDVYDLDVDTTVWGDALCYEVEIETWQSDAECHVIVDAFDGTVYAVWAE